MADSPAFQFYAADFLADENQRVMTPAEAGAYIRLICTCWIEGSIPDDVRRLAPLAGMSRDEMKEAWPQIVLCFEEHPTEPGRLIQPRVERERQKQRTYAAQMAKAGEKGARRRWGKKKAREAAPDKDDHSQAIATPSENDSQAIARPSRGDDQGSGDGGEPAGGGHGAPEKADSATPLEPLGDKGSDGLAMPTPMASDSSSSSSSSLEELTTSRPLVTRSEPDSQAMARPSPEAGEREGEHEERPAKPKHPELERLWAGGVMDVVRRGWHQGQERVELPDGKSVGIGLEYWLFNDLLHQTDDPDMAVWVVQDAPAVLGWDSEPRTLYWALRGQNFDAAFEAYLERHPPERELTAGMVNLQRLRMAT